MLPFRPEGSGWGIVTDSTSPAEHRKPTTVSTKSQLSEMRVNRAARQRRAEQAFYVVGQTGERECPRVVALLGEHLRNGRLERWGKAGGNGLKHEDQEVNLPDPVDERQ